MKASNCSKKYIEKELKVFNKNLNKAVNGFNKEDIHRLRVGIKKIKAFCELTENIFPEEFEAEKCLKLFRKVFKNAGEIREVHTNKEYIKLYNLPPAILKEYQEKLLANRKVAQHSLKKHVNHFKSHHLQRRENEMLNLHSDLTLHKLEQESGYFIQQECQQIETLRKEALSVANIHKIRKHLKKLLAVNTLILEMLPSMDKEKFIQELKNTEELIGTWHDKIVLKTSINDFVTNSKKFTRKEEITLKEVLNKIDNENRALIGELKPKIDLMLQLVNK